MDDIISNLHYKSNTEIETELNDLVLEKLQRYCDYLQNEVNRKKSSCGNGFQQLDTMARLEETGSHSNG